MKLLPTQAGTNPISKEEFCGQFRWLRTISNSYSLRRKPNMKNVTGDHNKIKILKEGLRTSWYSLKNFQGWDLMDGYSHSTFNNQDSRQVRNRHGIPPRWKRYLPNPGPCSRILFDNRLTTPDPSLRSATRQTIVVTKQTTGLTAAPILLENLPPNLPICLLVGQLQSSHRAEMRRVQPCLLWGRRGLSCTHYDRPTVLCNIKWQITRTDRLYDEVATPFCQTAEFGTL